MVTDLKGKNFLMPNVVERYMQIKSSPNAPNMGVVYNLAGSSQNILSLEAKQKMAHLLPPRSELFRESSGALKVVGSNKESREEWQPCSSQAVATGAKQRRR